MDFGACFEKKTKKRKMKKWVSTVKNRTIVKVAMSKKREGRLEKSDEKNIDFLLKK